MNPRDDVLISYANLAPDSVASGQVCPKCNGGHAHERSLSVGRTGAFLWWRCHRASCAFRGTDKSKGDGATTTDERRGRYIECKRTQIPPELKARLSKMYSIHEETIDRARWSYTPDYNGHGARVIFPIISPSGRQRGEQFRSYSGHLPKSFTNGELATNLTSWYRFRKYAKVLVIVEDIPSALRIAETERVDSLALLGTVLNFDRVQEIREEGYTRVWLSLDRDATAHAIAMKREFDKYLPCLTLKPLGEEDVKDMSSEQFELFIQECLM